GFRRGVPGFGREVVRRPPAADGREELADRSGAGDGTHAALEPGQALRAGVNELGVVDDEPPVVRVGRTADAPRETAPEAFDALGHARGDRRLHERAEVRAVARFIEADD